MSKEKFQDSSLSTLNHREFNSEIDRQSRESYDIFAKRILNENAPKHPLISYSLHWQFVSTGVKKKETPTQGVGVG